MDSIVIKGAREHNLKNIDLTLPRDQLVVLTGLSGSGKSSLAFDTLYAEGQRRYVESLSAYARQFLDRMDKPDVDAIEGLSPAISIEQKTTSHNPRSTVGTVTEIYDYLRLLYARVGRPLCFKCGLPIAAQTISQMADTLARLPEGDKIQILSPVIRDRKGEYKKALILIRQKGYTRVRLDGKMVDLSTEPSAGDKKKRHTIEVVVDRLVVKEGLERRLADSLETACKMSDGLVVVLHEEAEILFSERMACVACGVSYPEIAPRLFSFNSPEGACPTCDGLGVTYDLDPEKVMPNDRLSIRGGAIRPWGGRGADRIYYHLLAAVAQHYDFDLGQPVHLLSPAVRKIILYGSGAEKISFPYERDGKPGITARPFEGVIPNLARRHRETDSTLVRKEIAAYMGAHPCVACKGMRLKPESLAIRVGDRSIVEITRMSISKALRWMDGLEPTEKERQISLRIIKEIRGRLAFLSSVGLDYLTLDRLAGTLSGGESQRIRLATQIGSALVGVLYILDEPSIGLHSRDNARLLATLRRLRDLGNSVIVVEHDAETIESADWVVDMGPGAGIHGGYVVAQGTPAEIAASPDSLTGQYLRGDKTISLPHRTRAARGMLKITGATENNLKNIDVEIPLGLFTCVTGVSGSGKSTLVLDVLYKNLAHLSYEQFSERPGQCSGIHGWENAIDKLVHIDQAPIGRTPRSNPATYTGLFTPIRDLFAQVPLSRTRGYKAGRYSFNVKGGRCEACEGDGVIKIEMHFLPDVYVTCEACGGKRYSRETLDVTYRDKTIADVLAMTVDTALDFFRAVPQIGEKLKTLQEVGLGYIQLGQSATTLSGGEAQRIKLSSELSKRSTGRTLYILDEPTTGLHFADIQRLLDILDRFATAGNTVVIIEHQMDVIRNADWVIDLGPEGGDRGGEVVVCGTPQQVAACDRSHTGQFLRPMLGI